MLRKLAIAILITLTVPLKSTSSELQFQRFRDEIENLTVSYFETGEEACLDSAVRMLDQMKRANIIRLCRMQLSQTDDIGWSAVASKSVSQLCPDTVISVEEVQRDCIKTKQAVLDFMVTQDRLYTYIITNDTIDAVVHDVARDTLAAYISRLISPLFTAGNPLELTFDHHLALELYQHLIAPLYRNINFLQSLIIIPDDILMALPFESLVTDSVDLSPSKDILYKEYEQLSYMINKYALAYNFSLSTLGQDIKRVKRQKELGRKLLTMSHTNLLPELADKYNASVPPYGADETSRVSLLLWRHNNLTSDGATREYFIDQCSRYRWIYFAIPVIFRNEAPDSSVMLFSPSNSAATDDGQLFISDLLNCNILSDLMTLSGCQLSNYGQNNNAGLIPLPQALLLAGARSLLINLWRVDDITVSRFMAKYYWELKYKRQTNSIALKEAKVTSMKGTFKYNDREISRAHPYFWAPYILIGNANVRPPTFSTVPPKMVILIIYVIVSIYAFYMIRRTKKS
ncbi:MAG: CHAT domain-containing protein [candidate division KSB1 bacterium]|jgi:CHAT domain-containing protein|nr:CHAT domain-containing protein [candidate division KSB1 bacterium]